MQEKMPHGQVSGIILERKMSFGLSADAVGKLASAFDFSGGQIENITRKCDIESILYGDEYVTEEKIEQYCQEETIVRQSVARIGFI